jgi:AcrR family transcriptional regulator
LRAPKEARREAILVAALDLASQRGFKQAGMDEIGAAAGYTGPALYRYFSSKAKLLVALHERLIDMQLAVAEEVQPAIEEDPTGALARLVRSHIHSVLDNLDLYHLYLHERFDLPEKDAKRLRQKLLPYFEVWREAIRGHVGDLSREEVIGVQGAVIGVLHSPVYFPTKLGKEALASLLERSAWRVLGREEPPPVPQ